MAQADPGWNPVGSRLSALVVRLPIGSLLSEPTILPQFARHWEQAHLRLRLPSKCPRASCPERNSIKRSIPWDGFFGIVTDDPPLGTTRLMSCTRQCKSKLSLSRSSSSCWIRVPRGFGPLEWGSGMDRPMQGVVLGADPSLSDNLSHRAGPGDDTRRSVKCQGDYGLDLCGSVLPNLDSPIGETLCTYEKRSSIIWLSIRLVVPHGGSGRLRARQSTWRTTPTSTAESKRSWM